VSREIENQEKGLTLLLSGAMIVVVVKKKENDRSEV